MLLHPSHQLRHQEAKQTALIGFSIMKRGCQSQSPLVASSHMHKIFIPPWFTLKLQFSTEFLETIKGSDENHTSVVIFILSSKPVLLNLFDPLHPFWSSQCLQQYSWHGEIYCTTIV